MLNKLSTGVGQFTQLDWLHHYEREWFKPDIVAGVTAAAVVIPKALAYATVAGLPIQVGLYTAFLPMLIYAFLGSSRPLSVSTSATLAILSATALEKVAHGGSEAHLLAATATLTLLVGAILVVAALFHLGFVANFISEPVLTGFKAGIAVIIVLDQLPKLLGIHFTKGSFFHNVLALVQGLPHASITTVVLGMGTVGILVTLERIWPRAPAPLIAVACGIAAESLFGLHVYGIETVGYVPTGLPSFAIPDLSLVGQLWPSAVGIALMSFTESIAAGRAFAESNEPTPQPNRELLATGLANVGGALLGSMPAGGGTTQTAVNRLAGARTQLAGLVTAAVALGTMLLLAPFIGQMPHATLAAVVIVYSITLIKPAEFRAILAVRRTEFIWALAALTGVVLLGTLQGILVSIVVSLISLAHQVADPPVYQLGRKLGTDVFRPVSDEHSGDETFPGLLLVRTEGRIFFANAERIAQKIRFQEEGKKVTVLVLDFSGIYDLEYTALKMLIEAERRLRESGISLWLAGLNPGVLEMVRRSPLGVTLRSERMFFNLNQAVEHYLRMPKTDNAS